MTVFISYSHKDRRFIDELIGQLRQAGRTFWYDDHIQAGEKWAKSIDDAIANCKTLIVVNSTNSIESAFVQYEWAFALGANKPVIPIIIEPWNVLEPKIHVRLKEIQYVDFSNARNWDKLLEQLSQFAPEGSVSEIVRNASHALNDANPSSRLDAIKTLENSNDLNVVEILADAVQSHTAPDVRIYAALALSAKTNCEDPRAISGLNELLCSNLASLDDRCTAVLSLRSYGTEQIVPGLLCSLEDEIEHDQNSISDKQIELWCDAVMALREFKIDPVREKLEDLVLDMFRPSQVRQRAIDVLGLIGNPLSIPILKKVLEGRDRDDRIFAANSLARIGGSEIRLLLREKAKRARGQEKESLEHIVRQIRK